MSKTEKINLFRGRPLNEKPLNNVTARALKDSKANKDMVHCKNIDDLFKKLES